jgi:hypothetical protein
MLCGADAAAACGGVEISSQLTLPRLMEPGRYAPMLEGGGTSGYLQDIAAAIDREVVAWESWKKGGDGPLILNMSVGWEPYFGGAFHTSINEAPPRAQAVYAALERAACKGALIIAAAGNFPGPPNLGEGGAATDPAYYSAAILPAGWETENVPASIPGEGACVDAGKPLLYAVGGVDGERRLLANSRPKALPRLVAIGDHAVVRDYGSPLATTATLTGTSVAATVVSAAAAAVWSRQSGSKEDIVKILYTSGEPIPPLWPATKLPTADFGCCGRSLVRQVSVLAAVNAIPKTALSAWSCATCTPGFPDGPWGAKKVFPDVPASVPLPARCRGETGVKAPPGPPEESCPHWVYPTINATPWGGPQPGGNPCSHCTSKDVAFTLPAAAPYPYIGLAVELNTGVTFGTESISSIDSVILLVGPDIPDENWDAAAVAAATSYPLPGLSKSAPTHFYCLPVSYTSPYASSGYSMAIMAQYTTSTGATRTGLEAVDKLASPPSLPIGTCP